MNIISRRLPRISHGLYNMNKINQSVQKRSFVPLSNNATTVDSNPYIKMNTLINFAKQGTETVIERFGEMQRIQEPGLYIAIPFVDRLNVVDMREMVLPIDPQWAITKDNVRVSLSGVVYLQFKDSKLACYGARRPLFATEQQAQAVMRSIVGRMELDEILHNRQSINSEIHKELELAAEAWGLIVQRYEITDIVPDDHIQQAMDLQAQAERKRREQVKAAEAQKQELILISEGQRNKDINESEGIKSRLITEAEGYAQTIKLKAEAEKERLIQEAKGKAQEIILKAEATATGIEKISGAIAQENGMKAAEYNLAQKYFKMMGESLSKGSTVFLPKDLSDFNSMVGSGTAIWKSLNDK